MDRRRAALCSLAVLAVIVVVFVAFFWPATLRGRFMILHDSWCWSYPLRSVAWSQVRSGHWPLWTSGIFSGYPLLSMSQLGFGYPLTWLYLLNSAWGEQLYVLAPFVLSPAFTYLFARELGRSRLASLLAGMSFGYGGFMASPISHNGMLSNGFMWLPLALVAVERARTSRFIPCLLACGASYGFAVLSGIGQAFVTVALVLLAYGVFVWFKPNTRLPERSWQRFRPLAVALGGLALGAGIGAFQILETAQANRLSTRKALSYAVFSQGSAPVKDVLLAVIAPLHAQIGDVTSFVAPGVLLLAVIAVAAAYGRRAKRDTVVAFWGGTLVVAFLLMCGSSTPFYHLVHYIPFLNLFRVPPRHSAEWTLAAALLAAYGWDEVVAWLRARAWSWHKPWQLGLATALVGLVGVLSWRWNAHPPDWTLEQYLTGKAMATVALLGAGAFALCARQPVARALLCGSLIVLGTVSESYICVSRWWFPKAKTAQELDRAAPVTKYLASFPPAQQRIYSHLNAFGEEDRPDRAVDAPNLTALYGLHEVAGYDPMIFERYSQALGNTGMFALPIAWNAIPDANYAGPFNLRSHVLDLLNVEYVVRRLQPKEKVLPKAWEVREELDQLVVDVGDPEARRWLASGFREEDSLAGRTGAWTDGTRAVVRAYLLPRKAPYRLKLTAICYRDVAPCDLVVRVNGKRVMRKAMPASWRDIAVTLPGEGLQEGWNDISLALHDRRKLSVFVDTLSLTPVDSASVPPSEDEASTDEKPGEGATSAPSDTNVASEETTDDAAP